MSIVDRKEWLWIIAWSLIILIIVNVPYVYGVLASTPQLHFSGFIIAVEDGNTYLAKMREGWAGSWLFYLAYTPEPHSGAFFFSYYLLLGKLARLLRLDLLLALHLSRLLTITFGLWSFYFFVTYFTVDITIRRLAFLLFGLTAGAGWLWIALGLPAKLGAMPADLWIPETSFFLAAFTFPHLPLAQGLLLWIVVGSLKFFESNKFCWWVVASGAGLLVSLIHPYTLPILIIIVGLYILCEAYRDKAILKKWLMQLMLIALPSIPYLIYVLFVFETNFAFKVWRQQGVTFSPHPIHYVLGFGLIIPLAGVGLWKSNNILLKQISFLKIWILLVPLLLYLPISIQRRFLDGYQAPLALLGAVGMVWLTKGFKEKRQYILIIAAVLILMSLTNILLLVGGFTVVNSRQAPTFYSSRYQTAFNWLSDNSWNQIVFAGYKAGNLLPAYAPVRVFIGHGHETAYYEAKKAMLRQFFKSKNEDFRRQLLRDYRISYLFYGPEERTLGNFSPDGVSYLQQVYDNGAVKIYRVVRVDED